MFLFSATVRKSPFLELLQIESFDWRRRLKESISKFMRLWSVSSEAHDGCSVKERGGGFDSGLETLGEARAFDPRQEAFDHPTHWQDDQGDLMGLFPNDFDSDGRGRGHALVSAIGPDELEEWKQGAGHLKQRALRHHTECRRIRFDELRPPAGDDERVAPAALELLVRVVAARPMASVVLTLWLP
ncbi:hypothetical protein [Mesorhizobium mediterraneum]|uniref:hypothetical protein n=1 Tax=Mesorhizobium mediterraneum TaxID=43617 RepID=UPI00177B9EA8|nr:hypothetical protein [Mesorhizobium mediterraneum]